jgi:hypothetical protein
MTSHRFTFALALLICLVVPGCSAQHEETTHDQHSEDSLSMNAVADEYVKLVLAVGLHDDGYVDAYYGPEALKKAAEVEAMPLDAIRRRATELQQELPPNGPEADQLSRLRREYLNKQLSALGSHVDRLSGAVMSFDEESRALYDAVSPPRGAEHFQEVLSSLDKLLPGEGELADRYESFKKDFIIPKEKLDTVFQAAIAACKERTEQHMELPPGESFQIEYVNDKPWSGYNWYQGGFNSLIQVNTDLPIYIDRAIDLACHEGYPGHHVYNSMLEWKLSRGKGWSEFTIYPLYSPQSLIAEGSANFGIDIAFPGDERIIFEKEHLFPLAGLDPEQADRYYEVEEVVQKLSYAGNDAARDYLDGKIDAAAAADWLSRYALMPRARAEQRVRFIDTYRSYVINYNLGKDLVREYIEREAGDDAAKRWEVFGELLSSPRLPSGLK